MSIVSVAPATALPLLRPAGPWRDELARFAAALPASPAPPGQPGRTARALLVEVGSFAGESAEIFLASGRVGVLVCVDLWSAGGDTFPAAAHMADAEREFDRRTAGRWGGRVLKIKLPSIR